MADEHNNLDQTPEPEPPQETVEPGPVDALTEELEEARQLADSYKDQLLRKAAELENYRRRTEGDISNIIRNANEGLLLSLLPVLDDFERSLKHRGDAGGDDPIAKGIQLIYTKLLKILEGHGLLPFESVGRPFDVQYHDALLQMPSADHPPQTVVEEVERGYKLNDKVIRHAKVIVSAPPAGDPPVSGDEAPEENHG